MRELLEQVRDELERLAPDPKVRRYRRWTGMGEHDGVSWLPCLESGDGDEVELLRASVGRVLDTGRLDVGW